MAETKYISTDNLQTALDELKERIVIKETGKGLSTNDLTDELKNKYDLAAQKIDNLEATGGQANVIEQIKVNGELQSVDEDKAVDLTVPTKISDLTDDSDFVTAEEMNAKVSAVYKPSGSVTFAALPSLSVDILGNVYNVTDGFTTDEKFLEGAGNYHSAGTNVAVVDIGGGTYKYDVLSGFINLTPYAKTAEVTAAVNQAKQEAITSAASATDTKLLEYIKTSDLVPATVEEVEAMFASWGA